jgi:hypothetical protein
MREPSIERKYDRSSRSNGATFGLGRVGDRVRYGRPGGTDAVWPGQDWYRESCSQELTSFIQRASNNNWDLAEATARIARADARARQSGAAILPSIDVVGNVNYLEGHSANNVRAHTFKFITPADSEAMKIPNACNLCHADKTTAWATAALKGWADRSPWRVAQSAPPAAESHEVKN